MPTMIIATILVDDDLPEWAFENVQDALVLLDGTGDDLLFLSKWMKNLENDFDMGVAIEVIHDEEGEVPIES